MDQNRDFKFGRFVLTQLKFEPKDVTGTVEYIINTVIEVSEENSNDIRLVVSVKLRDSEGKNVFFDSQGRGFFSVSENFGAFSVNNSEEKFMLQIILDEFSNMIYNLSSKAFDIPMKVSLSVEDLLKQQQNEQG